MARSTNTWIARSLTSLLPRRRIVRLAAKLGVVRRRRKLDIVALVHCLVLGFSQGERRTLTGLRRAYVRTTGTRLAPSSFHARFSEELTSLMRTLSLEALQRQARMRPRLKAVFAPFVEVLAARLVATAIAPRVRALLPFSVEESHQGLGQAGRGDQRDRPRCKDRGRHPWKPPRYALAQGRAVGERPIADLRLGFLPRHALR